MKTKNIKVGDLVYVKTIEEMKQSKYFQKEGSGVIFENGTGIIFKNGVGFGIVSDKVHAGSVVEVVQIAGHNIEFRHNNELKTSILSRHAFRKPTEKELLEHKGE